MKTGAKGLELIKHYEGLRLKAYKCPAGIWTVGYGHTAGVKPGMSVTENEADKLLEKDLKSFEFYLVQSLNADEIEVNQNQFDALISFCYNLGVYTLVHGSRNAPVDKIGSLWSALKAGDKQKAADAFLLYINKGSAFEAGLRKRRSAERALFLS